MKLRLTWVQTTCDHCGGGGLLALVPQNEDGSIAGREFPSLCRVCHGIPGFRDKVVQRLLEEEGATSATVDRPGTGIDPVEVVRA
jgi:hypothetical protein